MLFSSIPFLYYFLPVVLICYFAAPRKLKNTVLLATSLFFYAWGEKLLVVLFALSILIGWVIGLLTEKAQKPALRKLLMAFAVIYDLGILGYFKYSDFFIENINGVLGTEIPLLNVALPIGISFYTFQLLSYNIDVYRRSVPAQKNVIDFAAYVSMFPQLIAGPIVRYSDVNKSLEERTHSFEKVSAGIARFTVGLSKKVLIANILGELCRQFRATSELSVLYFWMYAVAYSLQIYFDFSGYSDMAIGLGKVFGFEFMENFDYPYISASITEFWRRWHISLGSWFRDYVYIPLGGNRRGTGRQLLNIMVVWMLTGFWHGASWNFIFWGLLYAVLLTLEKVGFKKWLDRHKVTGHIYVIACVMLGFILFNAADLAQAGSDIAGLFSFGKNPFANTETLYYLRSYGFVLLIGIIGATPLPKYLVEKLKKNAAAKKVINVAEPLFYVVLLLTVTAYLVDGSFNPFLYFRF